MGLFRGMVPSIKRLRCTFEWNDDKRIKECLDVFTPKFTISFLKWLIKMTNNC